MAREQRRLAAILVADVVGYSRLVSRDEVGTLAKLTALRRDLIEPAIGKHSGRLFKAVGDGFLVDFASAVQAVACAVEIQKATPALPLRIGIHLGDVIVQGEDLMGDGVNIAARIEGVADAGGIAISRAVHEQVRDKLDLGFQDKGEIALKNLARPIHVFAVMNSRPTLETDPLLTLPDKPSIAVLPFQNMSGDPEQEYFADGMVEDITTALSCTKALFVIARNSSFAYKGRSPDIRQVGRELGVRYVLEGSVRRAGGRLRITAQLIEAASGSHIWAERFEGGLDDIFTLQDQVTSRVVGAIAPTVEQAEIERARAKSTGNLQAYDHYLRGLSCLYRFTREGNEESAGHFREAMRLDPEFALAHAFAAWWYSQRRTWGWEKNRYSEAFEAERLARRALELGKNDPRVLATCGWVLVYVARRIEEGADLVDRALELDQNFAIAWTWRSTASLFLGRSGAIEGFERALRLSPLDPRKFIALSGMGYAHMFDGRFDEAALWAGKALAQRPDYPPAFWVSMASQALGGRLEDAAGTRAAYQKLDPTAALASAREWMPFQRREDMELFERGLRFAGVPE